jgi:hypothetical protein
MSDDYQIEIPPSFYALYTDARRRLTEPLRHVRARYEACEDLANHLVEHARGAALTAGIADDEVLSRIHAGLRSPAAGVTRDEATWVVRRLAELIGWECPALEP